MNMKLSFSPVCSFLTIIICLNRFSSSEINTKDRIIKELNGHQLSAYMDVKNSSQLFSLIHESFTLKTSSKTGISKNELVDYIAGTTDPDLKRELEGIILLGDGGSALNIDSKTNTKYQKSLAVYGKRPDNKYDVLVVSSTQEKKLGTDKLIAAGAGSVCAGILVGTVTMSPVAGISTFIILASGSGVKATYDYSKEMPDVVLGYILKELVERGTMKILPDNSVQFMIRQ
jgi:hypothetical protein